MLKPHVAIKIRLEGNKEFEEFCLKLESEDKEKYEMYRLMFLDGTGLEHLFDLSNKKNYLDKNKLK